MGIAKIALLVVDRQINVFFKKLVEKTNPQTLGATFVDLFFDEFFENAKYVRFRICCHKLWIFAVFERQKQKQICFCARQALALAIFFSCIFRMLMSKFFDGCTHKRGSHGHYANVSRKRTCNFHIFGDIYLQFSDKSKCTMNCSCKTLRLKHYVTD